MYIFALIVLISFLSIIPYSLVVLLRFLLWKFSFTAGVKGFFSFGDIMLRIPLKLDFSILIRIKSLSLGFDFRTKHIKVRLGGFSLNVLVKKEFSLWTKNKVELL